MGKQQRGVETVERVLEAALFCFTSSGIYDATIEDIARRARVSIGSIYHHFASRDRIAFVLYCRWMESLLGAVSVAIARKRDARSGVRALVRAYLTWVGEHRQAARFIFAAGATELAEKWQTDLGPFKQRLLAPIFAWFKPHIDSGAVVLLPLALYEIVIIGPAAEFSRRWLSAPPGLNLAEATRILPETVWRSIVGSKPA
jgi:AcrR family transcriptional regulator